MTARKPNLFIVGAPKCGTTAWVNYLSAHPDVAFSKPKEPHYFCDDFPNFRWARDADEYARFFDGAAGKRVVGDASVQYLYSKNAAANIARFNPDARIMIFLRRQSTFLPSYHNQLVYNRDETIENFAEAWAASADMTSRDFPRSCREPSFLDYRAIGRFSSQIERYTSHFDRSRIMVLQFENWSADPRAAYLEVLDFLGLDDDGRTSFERVHGAHSHRNPVLADLTQRPPSWVLGASRAVKRLAGVKSLGIARRLRKFNRRDGYGDMVSPDLQRELDQFFAADNGKTQACITELRTVGCGRLREVS